MNVNSKKNIFILLSSSLIGISLSFYTGFVIPRELDYTAFSNFKVFTFYLAYIPLLHFGVVDGLLIKYSKININQINKQILFNTFYKFIFMQLIIGAICIFIGKVLLNLHFIYINVLIFTPLLNIVSFILGILIILEKFVIYASYNLILKITLAIFTFIIVITESNNFIYLVLAYYIATFIQIIIGFIVVDKNKGKSSINYSNVQTDSLFELFKTGLPVVLFYFIFTLIFGIDRIFIEFTESRFTYAMYSFAYSLITILLTIFESIKNFVFTQFLRSTNIQQDAYNKYFKIIINCLFLFSAILVILVNVIVKFFVPTYLDAIKYVYMLFPVIFLKLQFSLRIWPNINKKNIGLKIILNSAIVLLFGLSLNLIVFVLKINPIYYAIMTLVTITLFNLIMEFNFKKVQLKKEDKIWYSSLIVVAISYFNISTEIYLLLILYSLLIFYVVKDDLFKIIFLLRKK